MNSAAQPLKAESQTASTLANGTGGVNTSEILRALEIELNPRIGNETRQQAYWFMDQIRKSPDALQLGFALSGNPKEPVIVRSFGLSLLDTVVRHGWHQLDDDMCNQYRQFVIDLGNSLTQSGPSLLASKVAELWVEVAKRCWALDWYGLDELLDQFWNGEAASKLFVLSVLENLSEDVFVREDTNAVLRGKDLATALVSIFTSGTEHAGDIKVGQTSYNVRMGEEGWLSKITSFLSQCLQTGISTPQVKACVNAALATLRSAFYWIMTASISRSSCLAVICECLTKQDEDIIMATVEVLLAFYGRNRLEPSDIDNFVYPMCHPNNIAVLDQVFAWCTVGVEEIYSTKYAISKKLAEVLSQITEWIVDKPPTEPTDIDFSAFFKLLITVSGHESLIVSIPAVHCWPKILSQESWRDSQAVSSCMAQLLQFACQRTIQYDLLPEEPAEPAVVFVQDELELHGERQGFFLNYRRLCCQIIELVTFSYLGEATPHILSEVNKRLDDIQTSEHSFDPANYSRASMPVLHTDAQLSIVESAFKGFSAWRSAHQDDQSASEADLLNSTSSLIQTWSIQLLTQRTFKDPLIKQRVIKTAVEISNRALKDDKDFALKVLEYTLSALISNPPNTSTYAEAVDELHGYATTELVRLASHHADYFVTFFNQLELSIKNILSRPDVLDGPKAALTAALFLIVQRAVNIDREMQTQRLWQTLESILESWQEPRLTNALSSFEAFVEWQGFDRVAPYMASINAANLPDWSDVPLDTKGAQLREEMKQRISLLPTRITRVLLQVSTDKLRPGAAAHTTVSQLWAPILPTLLPGILHIISFNHRLHDASAWPNLPAAMQGVARRVLQDRYWQSGISEVSMNEFHAKIKSSRETLEGFASSVRSRIRTNLENSYSILHHLGKLGDPFYNIEQIPEMIAQTLVATAGSLSPHHFSVLLSMLTKLVDECPEARRSTFLPPVLHEFLFQLDKKCSDEWRKVMHKQDENESSQSNELGDEMREDSILRNFTYRAVNTVSLWIDPQRDAKIGPKKAYNDAGNFTPTDTSMTGSSQSLRAVCLNSWPIIEPMLMFLSHGLGYRDGRSCSNCVKCLRWMVPVFATGPAVSHEMLVQVREFISNSTLTDAIKSLNDFRFADQQRDLANLIATIWIAYGLPTHIPATSEHPSFERQPLTNTPREILLSLPGMTDYKVDEAARKLANEGGVNGNAKHQRAIILDLLQELRGVRLAEKWKYDKTEEKNKLMEKYARRENIGMQGMHEDAKQSNIEAEGVDLGGVSEMFGSG